jgi:hypothetical protein
MLEQTDVDEALDVRLGEALARWTGKAPDAPSFSRTGKGIAALRLLMETSAGAEGTLRRTLRDGVSVYSYVCKSPIDDRSVEGLGATGNLAICDAFLSCEPDYFGSGHAAAVRETPPGTRPTR